MSFRVLMIRVWIFLSLVVGSYAVQAQVNDSLNTLYDTDVPASSSDSSAAMEKRDKMRQEEHSPRKATIYSMVLPGLGQVYNKKYWKVPVLYAAGGALFYTIRQNHRLFRSFSDAYGMINDSVTTVKVGANTYTQEGLLAQVNYYRRWRDFSIIMATGLYFINMLDAAVDAHLMQFDIGPDLSLRWEPMVQPSGVYGAWVRLEFKNSYIRRPAIDLY